MKTGPIALLALALAGCGATDRQAPAPSESLVPLPTTQPAPPAPEPSPAPPVSTRPSPEPAANECGADKLGAFVNQLPTTETMDAVRRAVAHDRIRPIKPGDVVTMDYRADRLNVEIGVDGRIRLFRCG
jgi:hypothetical protein